MDDFFNLGFFSKKILLTKKILVFLILANFIGSVYGFIFYYGKQLLQTSFHLWLFVPDCPLFSLLMALSLFLILIKKESSFLFFFTLAGSLKYGFWTVFVLLYYNLFYFSPENLFLYSVLLISHVFLFFESFLLIKKIRFKLFYLIPVLVFFLANDFSDYFFNTHPPIPLTELNFLFYFTFFSSLFFAGLALFLYCNAVDRTA